MDSDMYENEQIPMKQIYSSETLIVFTDLFDEKSSRLFSTWCKLDLTLADQTRKFQKKKR